MKIFEKIRVFWDFDRFLEDYRFQIESMHVYKVIYQLFNDVNSGECGVSLIYNVF